MSNLFELPSPQVVRVSGPDAKRYLQARLSNDVEKATTSSAISAGALDPKGKVGALFEVFSGDADDFFLLSFAEDREQTMTELLRFKVAERLEAVDLSGKYKAFLSTGDDYFGEELKSDAAARIVEARFTSNSDFLAIVEHESLSRFEVLSSVSPIDDSFHAARVSYGRPWFPTELRSGALLSESDYSGFISFEKGCYPGQEVVEKIAALGKPPFALRGYIATDSELLEEQDVFEVGGEKSIGRVLSSYGSDQSGNISGFLRVRTASLENNKGFVQLSSGLRLSLVVSS